MTENQSMELQLAHIDLDAVSLSDVLATRQETALSQAIQREVNRRVGQSNDQVAGFNNFV